MDTGRLHDELRAALMDWITGTDSLSSEPAAGSERFEALAARCFGFQYATVAPYRAYCDALERTPRNVTRWQDIPVVSTRAFKEWEFTSLPVGQRRWVFHSSGTTGEARSRHYHDEHSLALYEASLLKWFAMHFRAEASAGASPAFICLVPRADTVPHSSLAHMFAAVAKAYGCGEPAWCAAVEADGSWALLTETAMEGLARAQATGRPTVVLGTAFSFVHLLDGLAAHRARFVLPPSSAILETGGYKGRSRELPKVQLHEGIAAALGLPAGVIVCEYGMSELSSQAYDRVAGPAAGAARCFRFPPWARPLVVNPETGQEVPDGAVGVLRVFDLANLRSVLAVETEDLARRCGRGFELLGRTAMAERRGCSLMQREEVPP
jgi:hypothetical protein